MSKIRIRNAANSAWDEVKKGFRVPYNSGWIEPKALKYRHDGAWKEHKFSSNRVFVGTTSSSSPPDRLHELNPETFAIISDKGGKGSNTGGLAGVGQSIYIYDQYGCVVEISPETASVIKVIGSPGQTMYSLGGTKDRLFGGYTYTEFYDYAMTAELSKYNGSIIKVNRGRMGGYGVIRLGGTADKLFEEEVETYASGGHTNQYLREVNLSDLSNTQLGILYTSSMSIRGLGGTDEKLYATEGWRVAELNQTNSAILKIAVTGFLYATITGLKS